MVRVAELYYAGNLLDDSWEGFQDALQAADEAGRDDLVARLRKRMADLYPE